MKRILSGVQPTGALHLGNYLGAIKQFAAQQVTNKDDEKLYCVVDLHAITVDHDPKTLAQNTREIAAAYLACGVESTIGSCIFVQSHVPAHTELAWMLNCVARMGWMERMTQFREKTKSAPASVDLQTVLKGVRRALELNEVTRFEHMPISAYQAQVLCDALSTSNTERASVGLFTYPILMAADILAYKATHVPVGDDQKQHLYLARDIAQKFNHDYSTDMFPIPDPMYSAEGARVMSLQDASRKMSKSDPDPLGRLNLTDTNDAISKKIRRATATTEPFPTSAEGILRPEITNLITIYAALSGQSHDAIYASFGGQGYGVFKPALADLVISVIEPIRTKMNDLLTAPDHLDSILHYGASRARIISEKTITEAKEAMGFLKQGAH